LRKSFKKKNFVRVFTSGLRVKEKWDLVPVRPERRFASRRGEMQGESKGEIEKFRVDSKPLETEAISRRKGEQRSTGGTRNWTQIGTILVIEGGVFIKKGIGRKTNLPGSGHLESVGDSQINAAP